MEIFQTIWTVLTNENEMLIKLNAIPSIFIESILYMLLFLTILKIDSTKKQRIFFVLSFSIISILNSFFGVMPFNNFINVLAMPLLVLFIFKTNILKAILSEIVTYTIVILISTLLISLYTALLNVPAVLTSTVPIHKICFSLIFYFSLYVFYIFCKNIKFKISILDKFRNAKILIINFIIGSIAICIEYYLLFKYIDFIPAFLVFATLLVISIYFLISMFSLIRTNKLELTTQLLEEQKMYNRTLNTMHDKIRGFKHDFDNIILSLGGYISSRNLDGLTTYYNSILEECKIINSLNFLNPELINNPAIYGLLSDKYYKSEKLGIKINLEIMMDLSNLNIKMYELTRILGVLFDNAIEAASKCDIKTVNIIFRKDKRRNKDLIIIQNTYINKDVNIDKIFEKGYTSKQDNEKDKNHGLGLWEVRKYLRKNTHLDLYTTKTDNLFTQQFEIYN